MITIQEVTTNKQLVQFVKFPFKLYKECPYWVPPLTNDELETLDKTKNPVFKNAEASYFLAYKQGTIVGRIAVILNHIEINEIGKKKVRFGWLDMVDDINVTKALLTKAYEIGAKNNLAYVEGPVGFSNMEKAGILTSGFEELNTMITWYQYPYYAAHFEQLGYEK
ncbi:MAG: GTP cyclohydrolase, partial [Ulvibacter sp.]|nr:GTP cyclohydrolase [Ulvibacter sp.]